MEYGIVKMENKKTTRSVALFSILYSIFSISQSMEYGIVKIENKKTTRSVVLFSILYFIFSIS